jgi:LysR family transcriptional regulator of gallate degradation
VRSVKYINLPETMMNNLQRTKTQSAAGTPSIRAQNAGQFEELLNLSHLRAFVNVAESGNIARAAKKHRLAHSSISRSIQQIEEYLGVSLLERLPRGMVLSSYGKQILPRAQKAINELGAIARANERNSRSSSDLLEHLLNTRRLQVFVKLCEQPHTRSVAAELGISQPAISLGIKILESGVGAVLFERSPLGFMPTRQAMLMELNCRRALNELRLIPAEIAALRGSMEGVVTIGSIPLGRPLILPDAIAEVATRHARVHVVTRESPFEELISGLRARDIDFIFGPLLFSDRIGHLKGEALFEEDVALLVGKNNELLRKRVLVKDLGSLRWILPRKGAPARLLLESVFENAGLRPPVPVVESGDLAIIRGLLMGTDMVAALLSHQMAYEIAEGTIRRLPIVFPETVSKMGLFYRAEERPSPAAQVLMDSIRGIAGKQGHLASERPVPS